MKVKELIELLKQENLESIVVVDGYESGYDELKKIHHVNIIPNPHKGDLEKDDNWWDGEFKHSMDKKSEVAILLPRSS